MCVKINGAIFFILVSLQVCVGKLPSSIVPCYRDDPHLDSCIIEAVESVKPLLAHGDLGDGHRVPSLEPLHLDNIELGRDKQFQVIFSDMTVRGGSNFTINKLTADASKLTFDVALTLPRIDFTGKYLMVINILLLDLQGRGNVKGYAENAKALVKVRGVRFRKNGAEYVKFTKMPLKITIDVFKLHMDNLFSGDRVLGEVGNSLINENRELYLNQIIPGLERGLSKKFLDIANTMVANTTYDEMFPI